MREIRTSGSEGGAGQANAPSLPLSKCAAMHAWIRPLRGDAFAFCSGAASRADGSGARNSPAPLGTRRRSASANEVTMIPTSESLSPPGTSYGRAAGGNCVAARRGGEQPEADPRSRTQVNPIRLPATASLLANGEACRGSGDPSGRHPSSKARAGVAGDGWGGNAGKVSWRTVESCPGRTPRQRRRAAVRAAVVALKRGNARGAKGGRKVERPRP